MNAKHMLNSSRTSHVSVVALVSVGLLVGAVAPQADQGRTSPQRARITVDDPRPLAEAIKVFQEQYGIVVTYEDPPYAYQDDFMEPAFAARREDSQARLFIPKGGPLVVEHNVPALGEGEREIFEIVKAIVDGYHAGGYPGEFTVSRAGAALHVTPTSIRNRAGTRVVRSSPLETPVALSAVDRRSSYEALESVLQAVTTATRQPIVMGTVPTNLLRQTPAQEGFDRQPARDLLVALLAKTGNGLSWRMLYDPGMEFYAFNILTVTEGRSRPALH